MYAASIFVLTTDYGSLKCEQGAKNEAIVARLNYSLFLRLLLKVNAITFILIIHISSEHFNSSNAFRSSAVAVRRGTRAYVL